MNPDLDKVVADVLDREQRNREALSMLLSQQREKNGHLLALRLRMGRTPSYLATVPLSWVAQHVHFAGDLPIFKGKGKTKETSKEVLVDAGTVDSIQQRRPDWRRQLPMAVYLATRPNRKFPPLVVVGYKGWVYADRTESEEWGEDERAMHDCVSATPLEPEGAYHDLDVKDTNYYALDGQHRLMAIMGLQELLSKGRLIALDQDGNPNKPVTVTREQVIDEICRKTGKDEGTVHEQMQRVMDGDHIGIEIIPAVVAGETYTEALLRLRSVFVDVNENAKKPTKGDSILLDESNGFRIAARRVMVTHKLLKGRVELKQGQLSESSAFYTSLETIAEIARTYLKVRPEFSGWENPMFGYRQLGFIRPDESDIDKATDALAEYFAKLAELPSHVRFLQGKKAGEIRGKQGEDNVLFRPITQMALAEAVAILERDHEKSWANIVEQLTEQEENGQLKLRAKNTPWFGVLCNPITGKMLRQKQNHDLCVKLFVYLLGGGIADDKQRRELRERFENARQLGNNQAVDANGESVDMGKVRLPDLW